MWPGPEFLVPAVTVALMDRPPLQLMMGKSDFTTVYLNNFNISLKHLEILMKFLIVICLFCLSP